MLTLITLNFFIFLNSEYRIDAQYEKCKLFLLWQYFLYNIIQILHEEINIKKSKFILKICTYYNK